MQNMVKVHIFIIHCLQITVELFGDKEYHKNFEIFKVD